MNIGIAMTYTGIALVFLSTLGYSIRVAINPEMASLPFTLTFCVLNAASWIIGANVRRKDPNSQAGYATSLLGDVLFPLSVYSVLAQYVPGLRGRAAHSAWVDVALGVVFHVAGCYGLMPSRFPKAFFSYFFALAPVVLIFLLHGTHGLPMPLLAWGVVGFTLVTQIVSERRATGQKEHERLGHGLAYLAAAIGAFFNGAAAPGLPSIAAGVVASALTVRMVLADRNSMQRLAAAIAYLTITCTFTLMLLALGATNAVLLCFTAAWVCALTAQGILLRRSGRDAIGEGAQWVSILLAAGLAWFTNPIWLPLAGPAFGFQPVDPLAALGMSASEAILAPISLAIVSFALFASAYWNRRHPTISQSMGGFVANQAILGSLSYLSPILTLMAGGAAWAVVKGSGAGVAWTEFAIGAVFLAALSNGIQNVFPRNAIDVAGTVGFFLAGMNAMATPSLAGAIFGAATPLLLWRSNSHTGVWIHLASLAALTMTGVAVGMGLPAGMLWTPIAAVSVASIVLWRILPRAASPLRARSSLVLTMVTALASGIFCISHGSFSPSVYLILWAGLLMGLLTDSRAIEVTKSADAWLLRLVHAIAMAAGGGLLLGYLNGQGVPAEFSPLALIACSWAYLALWRGLASSSTRSSMAMGTLIASQLLGVIAIVMAPIVSGPLALATAAISFTGLWFQMGLLSPSWRAAALIGYTLAYASLLLGAFTGADGAAIVLSGAAVLYLQRSAQVGSGRAHLLFVLAALAAALIRSLQPGAEYGFLPLAALSVAFVLASRWVRRLEGQNTKVRATIVAAIVAGLAALALESFAGAREPIVYATCWVGLLIALSRWERRRSQIPIAFADRRTQSVRVNDLGSTYFVGHAEDVRSWGYAVAHLAGAGLVMTVANRQGIAWQDMGLVLAAWAWFHLAIQSVLQQTIPHRAATRVTGKAMHVFAAGALVLTLLDWRIGLPAAGVAGAIALFYLAYRQIVKSDMLEHLAAAAFISCVALVGITLGISNLDYYFAPIGLYLALNLMLRYRRGQISTNPRRSFELGVARLGGADIVPLVVLLLNVVHPFIELARDPAAIHLFLLGLNSLVLLHALLVTRQQSIFVYAGCLLFTVGAVIFVAFGEKTSATDLFLVFAGALGLSNLAFIQPSTQAATGPDRR